MLMNKGVKEWCCHGNRKVLSWKRKGAVMEKYLMNNVSNYKGRRIVPIYFAQWSGSSGIYTI